MQTWAKRGIQTALVTGGLLMLGTGIASADENTNPDMPPSPLDISVKVPVKIDNNSINTPLGPIATPAISHDIVISPADLARSLPAAQAAPALASAKSATTAQGDALRANKVIGDVVVPVDISGNALGVLSDAAVENESEQHVDHATPISTSGADSGLAGNVVALQYALPVQVTGNAAAVGGNAETYNTANQSANAGGDIETDGTHGSLAGNVAAVMGATPVQLNGNALGVGGNATADSAAYSEATSGGTIHTTGDEGSLAGNVAGVPLGVPVQGNGNSLSVAGIAETFSSSDAYAQAGKQAPGILDSEQYILTSATPGATASGNVVQPAVAGPVSLSCNAATAVGNSDALCLSSGEAEAGGGSLTSGVESTLSGSIAHAPVAIPTQASGNAAGVVGNAATDATNVIGSTAGGDSYTKADGGVLSGSVAEPSVGAPVDLCGNVAAGAGMADALCTNDSVTSSGGDAGTTGSDSVGGGNEATVPVALPAEILGSTAGAVGGNATTLTGENKTVTSGGDNSTDDDAGTLAANLVTVPVAGPVQLGGNSANAAGNSDSTVFTASDITAGGYSKGKGDGGTIAGNLAQVPVAIPTQVFGDGASVAGHGTTHGGNDGISTAGGDAVTSGVDGTATGNVASVPVASAVQSFAENVSALGAHEANFGNVTESTAGGTVDTTGQGGALAGNVAGVSALPLVQTFGAAVAAAGGQGVAAGTNMTDATSGGDITTTGDEGFLSGDLLDAPVAAVVQPHGDAVAAVAGDATGASDNMTNGTAGGVSTTSGTAGSLSGIDGDLPIGANAPIYNVPVEVIANAVTYANNSSNIAVGEQSPQLELPQAGALSATSLPRYDARSMGSHGGLLDGLLGGTPLAGLLGGLSGHKMAALPIAQSRALPMPSVSAPSVPGLDKVTAGLFSGNLFQAPSLDRMPVETPALSGLPLSTLADTQSKLAGVFGQIG